MLQANLASTWLKIWPVRVRSLTSMSHAFHMRFDICPAYTNISYVVNSDVQAGSNSRIILSHTCDHNLKSSWIYILENDVLQGAPTLLPVRQSLVAYGCHALAMCCNLQLHTVGSLGSSSAWGPWFSQSTSYWDNDLHRFLWDGSSDVQLMVHCAFAFGSEQSMWTCGLVNFLKHVRSVARSSGTLASFCKCWRGHRQVAAAALLCGGGTLASGYCELMLNFASRKVIRQDSSVFVYVSKMLNPLCFLVMKLSEES